MKLCVTCFLSDHGPKEIEGADIVEADRIMECQCPVPLCMHGRENVA